jgi:hypothetical protein
MTIVVIGGLRSDRLKGPSPLAVTTLSPLAQERRQQYNRRRRKFLPGLNKFVLSGRQHTTFNCLSSLRADDSAVRRQKMNSGRATSASLKFTSAVIKRHSLFSRNPIEFRALGEPPGLPRGP